MRETWEKSKSDFIEVTLETTKTTILINKNKIESITHHNSQVRIHIKNEDYYPILETYEEIKELLGL